MRSFAAQTDDVKILYINIPKPENIIFLPDLFLISEFISAFDNIVLRKQPKSIDFRVKRSHLLLTFT